MTWEKKREQLFNKRDIWQVSYGEQEQKHSCGTYETENPFFFSFIDTTSSSSFSEQTNKCTVGLKSSRKSEKSHQVNKKMLKAAVM